MLRIKFTVSNFDELLHHLNQQKDCVGSCEMTWNERPEFGFIDVLYHRVTEVSQTPDQLIIGEGFYKVFVRVFRNLSESGISDFVQWASSLRKGLGIFFVVIGEIIRGYYVLNNSVKRVGPAVLLLVGPGMERIALTPITSARRINRSQKGSGSGKVGKGRKTTRSGSNKLVERYDRLAGLLGDGDVNRGLELILKARALRVVLVGTGRSGSQLALRLAQEGVGAEGGLVIVDPDVVETHNLDGMILPPQAVGYPKAHAVSCVLKALFPDSRLVPINRSMSDPEAVEVIRTADIMFSCVDEDSVRYGLALIASMYLIPHFDVCGGSARTGRSHAVIGGEMRYFVPGSPQGCIVDFGTYDQDQVKSMLMLGTKEERSRRSRENWQNVKGGSSADVLLALVAETMMSFWAFLKGDVRESRWMHYEKGPSETIVWEDWTEGNQDKECTVCGHLSGLGDTF